MEMKKAEDMASAKRLIAARKAAGLGQSRLAARCYYEQSTIANVEQGRARMSLSLAKAVGKELNVSVAWLLGLDVPKFNNGRQIGEDGKPIRGTGKMVFDWFQWERDGKNIPKIHPTQKPVAVLKRLIEIFTDPGEVVIDPCCGSGTTLRAARELGRETYGFEIDRNFYKQARDVMLKPENDGQMSLFEEEKT